MHCITPGWIGNVAYDPNNIQYFAIYFSVTMSLILVMFTRTRLLKIMLYFLSDTLLDRYIGNWIRSQRTPTWSSVAPSQLTPPFAVVPAVRKINKQHVVFFTKTDDLELLNKAVLYIRENELTER